jgi:hypothetical protein
MPKQGLTTEAYSLNISQMFACRTRSVFLSGFHPLAASSSFEALVLQTSADIRNYWSKGH